MGEGSQFLSKASYSQVLGIILFFPNLFKCASLCASVEKGRGDGMHIANTYAEVPIYTLSEGLGALINGTFLLASFLKQEFHTKFLVMILVRKLRITLLIKKFPFLFSLDHLVPMIQ